MNEDWFNQRLEDGGPTYMETHLGNLIVEPWNAFSSLLILFPAIYWIYRMTKDKRQSKFLWFIIFLIIMGGVGSSLYHAFRVSMFFLIMDVLPSAILTITLTIYFWVKVLKKWWIALLIMAILFSFRYLIWGRLPEHTSINLSYFITGLSIGLPLVLYLYKTRFVAWSVVAISIASFIIALTFRQMDHIPFSFLPMGTHFLWHTFSALGAYFILGYLYRIIGKTIHA